MGCIHNPTCLRPPQDERVAPKEGEARTSAGLRKDPWTPLPSGTLVHNKNEGDDSEMNDWESTQPGSESTDNTLSEGKDKRVSAPTFPYRDRQRNPVL